MIAIFLFVLNYYHLFELYAKRFDKLKRALACFTLRYCIWSILLGSNGINFCEIYSISFDKWLQTLMKNDISGNIMIMPEGRCSIYLNNI